MTNKVKPVKLDAVVLLLMQFGVWIADEREMWLAHDIAREKMKD